MFIVKYTKWLLLPIGIYFVYLFGKMIYSLYNYTVDHFYYERFVNIMIGIGILLGAIIFIVILAFILSKLYDTVKCYLPTRSGKPSLISRFITWLFIDVIGAGCIKLGTFFGFFWKYIMTVKKDYCPGITWEEDKK